MHHRYHRNKGKVESIHTYTPGSKNKHAWLVNIQTRRTVGHPIWTHMVNMQADKPLVIQSEHTWLIYRPDEPLVIQSEYIFVSKST